MSFIKVFVSLIVLVAALVGIMWLFDVVNLNEVKEIGKKIGGALVILLVASGLISLLVKR